MFLFASKKVYEAAAVLVLLLMFSLMFFSSLNDSAIMDELAHIPAGYSYLTQKDYRLNPEHPPLAKDISALPLLFLNLNFPTDAKAWTEDINGQWDMGRIFLYESENNPAQILFWSRLPMMLLTAVFGWLVFIWARGLYGAGVGLLTLLFFALSPTFIAHGRFVTTDIAAALGFFIGIVAFTRWLQIKSFRRLLTAGLALGGALLLKFSTALLLPIFVFLSALWGVLALLDSLRETESFGRRLKMILKEWLKIYAGALAILVMALIVTAIVYQYHVWNYPLERQLADAEFILSSFGFRPAVDLTLWMIQNPFLRGLGQYVLGLLMVIQRAAGGNDAYFLGSISSSGWWYYFPTAFLLKEPFAFILLLLLAVVVSIKAVFSAHEKSLTAILEWMRDNFFLTVGFLFIAVYWLQSMRSPLNIGVRHVLPTYPFIHLLVSREIVRWLKFYSVYEPRNLAEWFYSLYERYIKALPRYFLFTALILSLLSGILFVFPHYLSYYNILGGGTKNGYKYIVDSNYDWGQDLGRLRDFADKENIEHIAVDYFGGGSPSYELGEKFVPWYSAKGRPDPSKGDPEWFAVSLTTLQGALAKPAEGFVKKPENSYSWLENEKPRARAGLSIFIYKF